MAGVDAAGLVLGALPLIIEGVKAYSRGVSTIKAYIKYQSSLVDLYEELETERVMFQNVCDELLDELVEDNREKAALLKDPGGDAWKNNRSLEEKLRALLSGSYDVYQRAMRDMVQAITEIEILLKLGPHKKVQINSNNRLDKEKKKLKFCLKKKEYDGWIARIRKSRKTLAELLRHGLKVESRSQGPRKLHNTCKSPDLDFSNLQKYAALVYDIIRSGLKCACRSSHGVNLQLEPQTRVVDSSGAVTMASRFRVVFSHTTTGSPPEKSPWTIDAVEIFRDAEKPVNGPHSLATVPKPEKKRTKVRFQDPVDQGVGNAAQAVPSQESMDNLCLTSQPVCFEKTAQENCLVVLKEEIMKQKFRVIQHADFMNTATTPALLPLQKALASSNAGEYRRRFSNTVRLHLSVVLAWNMLQLYSTPWMSGTWGIADINLLDISHNSLLDRPLISRTFSGDSMHTSLPVDPPAQSRSRSRPLLSLAMILTELCLGAPFDTLREEYVRTMGIQDMSSDFEVVDWLIEDVYDQAGDTYGDAVSNCIRYAVGGRNKGLDDESFRKTVYNDVVVLLEQNLDMFHGGKKKQGGYDRSKPLKFA